jgi:LysM repeat protein
MAEPSAPKCPHCGSELRRVDSTIARYCPSCGAPTGSPPQSTEAPPTPDQYSTEQRSAVLDKHIAQLVRHGYRVTSRTETTSQLVKPKEFSLLWALVWLLVTLFVFGLGIIIYILYYLAQKDQTAYLEVDPFGNVQVTPESARRLIGGRPQATQAGLSPTASRQGKRTYFLPVAVLTAVAVLGVTGSCCIVAALAPQSPSHSAATTVPDTVATPQSLPTATPVTAPADTPVPTPSHTTYTVQSGDTLASIAEQFGTTYQAIMQANGLADTTIYSGTQLIIPVRREGEPSALASPSPGSTSPHVTHSLSEFEASRFCLDYGCTLDSSWDLTRGGLNNSYDLAARRDVSVEVVTLDDLPVDFGLTFYERARLGEDDFKLVNLFLNSIYPGMEVDPAVTAFIQENVETDVFQICQADSFAFASLRIWAGKIIQQTVHVGADCP